MSQTQEIDIVANAADKTPPPPAHTELPKTSDKPDVDKHTDWYVYQGHWYKPQATGGDQWMGVAD
jgi:hypothetical protein